MATSINSSGITFPDATTQTTAAGGIPAFSAVGSIAMLYFINASGATTTSSLYEIAAGDTLSGSSLRYISLATGWKTWNGSYGYVNGQTNFRFSNVAISAYLQGATQTNGVTALSGTWRVLQGGVACQYYDEGCNNFVYRFLPVLMQRIS